MPNLMQKKRNSSILSWAKKYFAEKYVLNREIEAGGVILYNSARSNLDWNLGRDYGREKNQSTHSQTRP